MLKRIVSAVAPARSHRGHRARRGWTSRDETVLLRTMRGRRLAVWTAIGTILLGAAAGLASLLRPAPGPYLYFISVDAPGGEASGADAAVQRDRQALTGRDYFQTPRAARESATPVRQMEGELADLAACGASDVAVIYVAGRAAVGEDGKIVLLLDNDDAEQSSQLSLGDVLVRIRNCPARKKLLVLDVVHAACDLVADLSSQEVGALIPGELAAVADPQRLTLVSCSEGQTALVSETFRRSGFGYYFELGLRGAADGFTGSECDGRVSVRELAGFLRERVDRWARATHGAEQTPVLYGERGDFDLVAIPARRPAPWLSPVAGLAARTYPKWLLAAWQQRDKLLAGDAPHRQPRLFRQFEQAVLLAEAQWRMGRNDNAVHRQLVTQTALIQRRIEQAEAETPAPEPHALACWHRRDYKPDAGVVAQLDALLKQVQSPAPGTPPDKAAAQAAAALDKFTKQTEKANPLDVALAAIDALYRERSPSPAMVRLIDHVISQRQPQPRFVETHFVRRLVELAAETPADRWPTNQVRLALRVMRLSQQAAYAGRPFCWTAALLTEAAGLRHNGDALLLTPGYAPAAEATAALREAEHRYESILAYQATLEEAYDALDRARLRLPQYAAWLEFDPTAETAWSGAIDAACALDDALAIDPAAPPPGATELGKRLERIREQAAALSGALAQLARPWSAERIDELCRRARGDLDSTAVARVMRALLDVPWLDAAQRVKLWQALYDVELRLQRQVVALDEKGGRDSTTFGATDSSVSFRPSAGPTSRETSPRAAPSDQKGPETSISRRIPPTADGHGQVRGTPIRFRRETRELETGPATAELARRVRWARDLLRLGGMPATEFRSTTADGTTAGTLSSREIAKRAAQITAVFASRLPDALRSAASPAAQVRLAAIVPPRRRVSLLDEPGGSPFVRLERQFAECRWRWLAAHYLYLSRDICGPAFNAEIARRYLAVAGRVEQPYVLIQAPDRLSTLTAAQPVQSCQATWKRIAQLASQTDGNGKTPPQPQPASSQQTRPQHVPAHQSPSVSVLSPTDRLHVSIDSRPTADGAALVLRFELEPGTDNAGSSGEAVVAKDAATDAESEVTARGVMLRVESDGRTYHHPIALLALAAGPQLEVLLSSDPAEPAAPLNRLWLRPAQQPQPYYLYVANPTGEDREVLVAVSTAAQPSPPLKIAAGGVQRVVFPPQPLKPGQSPPELADALSVRVLDGKTQQPLAERRFPIEVVSPRQYVRVEGSEFVPHEAGKNRLSVTLRAYEMPPGPPCYAELAISPDEVPGLEGITAGMLRGVLPADGSPLTLVAENLLLADGYPEPGAFCLNVDGVARTFRFAATFARRGDPTTPRELLRPLVRITAERYAKAAPGFPVAVHVENAADGSLLKLELGKAGGGVFVPDLSRETNRPLTPHVGFNPGGLGGAIQFVVSLDDWRTELDTTGIVGRRQLRAQLVDPLGNVSRVDVQDVILDDTPPRGLAFLQAPPQAPVKQPIVLVVRAIDDISGIKQASFFLGRPKDGKPPEGAQQIPARPLDRGRLQWQAQLPGRQQAGPIDVTAQVTNNVGLTSFLTTSIQILDQMPKAAGSELRGVVVEGGRPQANLSVALKDAKGGDKGTAMTNAQGRFRFTGLKPGKYTVTTSKNSSQRKGRSEVEVKAGQAAVVVVELVL